MAIKWIDGFDLYSATIGVAGRYGVVTNGTPTFATGRFGVGQCVYMKNLGIAHQIYSSAVSALACGFAFKIAGLINKTLMGFKSGGTGGTDQFDVRLTSGGALQATRNGTVLGTSAGSIFTAGGWHYVEIEVLRSATVGTFNIYLDGVSVLSLTGLNTGSADVDSMDTKQTSDFTDYWYDDMYFTDSATRLGECRIDTLRPSADTAQKDWTPNSGANNYSRVGDTTYDGDTTYVSAATVGNKDLYDLDNLPFSPLTIHAVQVVAAAKKDDATTRTFRSNVKSSSTTANGATKALSTSYQIFSDILATDPATSAAWTESGVNAMQIGPEVVA